ncbi:hypothetical protein CYMTET_19234, partial [Cymbomonas tetramitiformis]
LFVYCVVALPEMVGGLLENSSFDIMTIFSSQMPRPAVKTASMAVLFNLYTMAYFMFTGLAQAVAIRVGNAIGGGLIAEARRVAKAGLMQATLPAAMFTLVFLLGGAQLARIFTSDHEVVRTVSAAMPIAALCLTFDGLFTVMTVGVLAGQGDTKTNGICRVLLFVSCGTLGWFLGCQKNLGLNGLWWGIFCSLSVVAIYSLVVVLKSDWAAACEKAKDRQRA